MSDSRLSIEITASARAFMREMEKAQAAMKQVARRMTVGFLEMGHLLRGGRVDKLIVTDSDGVTRAVRKRVGG